MFYCTLAGFMMSFMYCRAMDTEGVKVGPKTFDVVVSYNHMPTRWLHRSPCATHVTLHTVCMTNIVVTKMKCFINVVKADTSLMNTFRKIAWDVLENSEKNMMKPSFQRVQLVSEVITLCLLVKARWNHPCSREQGWFQRFTLVNKKDSKSNPGDASHIIIIMYAFEPVAHIVYKGLNRAMMWNLTFLCFIVYEIKHVWDN